MANRVTDSEVKAIMETEIEDISAFISYANTLVDEYLEEKDLSDATLKEIERWLAAHGIASTLERQAIEQVAGPAEQKFSDVFGSGFHSSTYGQMAMNLDTTGTLAKLNDSKKEIDIQAL